MKVTFVTDTYTPQANGVATTLERLVFGLRERGHIVDVVRPAVLACDEEGLEVPSFGFPGYREVRFGFPMKLVLQSRWNKNRPDVIYVATETPLGASAISAARALGIPVASGFHTNFQQYVAHYRLPLLEKATMSYLRRLHNRSVCTFVPSHDVIDQLDACGFENLQLLPKGVDTRLFSPRKRSIMLRQRWGLGAGGVVGLYVGRLAAEKNLPLIIETFREIQKRIPDFKGVFVGDGPKLEELRRNHPDFVFAGVLRGEALAEHYASADLFIFPSITETFGNVTLEAMASGLAVVAYNYAAARQHIVSGVNGFTAPFDDRQAYLELAVKAAATDLRPIREEAREAARKVRWKKVVKRFEIQLEGLAAREPFEREPGLLAVS
ncbi:MAG: glycosyltransferase family 1 protein [Verrucomicrobiales bacterium]|jgi:glycosyltransferase involved in cell wall biosynthesis|nr:glycosyltransferase family 1 protein [Verrucomicrobiales bacterium]